ncbi:flagellar assembly protein FliW [Salibacterium qingdaonense]|uniref:Flagellar assembly factor FliW n=1 Tax=Salibacterium qingdaonense TaxID=266892 RepID=A0A1I4L160_9BACI|nr:flagellar assembly protein FliW [Salibacterium qingdaonense]SFL84377.1 flagellar assembly factor FliW [Salibacterium qingdaonense]
MNIQTKYFGEVTIDDNRIIRFDHGLPAFEEETAFVLLPFSSDEVFFILQSVHTPQLGFVVTDPFQFFNDYQVEVPDSVVEQLAIERQEDVALFVTLTLEEPFSKTTANLQAPILLNMAAQKGKQHILSESPYERKHFIFPHNHHAEQKGAR